jgi:ABC-type phosphate/phosphonate transport system substrate-binding protein
MIPRDTQLTRNTQLVANARMYSVSPEVAALWRELLTAIIAKSGVSATVIDYPAPAPLDELWSRPDKAAVFMCGLPFSRAEPQPVLMAAPVPAAPEFDGQPQYWSDFVVRKASEFQTVEDTYGGRIAFTVPDSQSGCIAALSHFMSAQRLLSPPAARSVQGRDSPLFSKVIAPTITPLGNLTAVVEGAADVAPIDAYALRLLSTYRPDLWAEVRVVGRTQPTPIPPLVASQSGPELQAAFLEAHQIDTTKQLMHRLLLRRFAQPNPGAYAVLSERFAAATDYWREHRIAASIHPAFQA